jgi:rhodanese-related sulfurtransferase
VSGALPVLTAPAPASLQPYELGNADLRSIYLIVIDVRTPADYANRGGHFMGAVSVPASDLPLWQSKLPRDAQIVLYDQTGAEADRLTQDLQATGLARVQSLAGGYDAWVRSYGITFLIAERQ